MSKQSRLMPGARVRHNFSRDTGKVVDVRKDPLGYDYCVEWDYPDRLDHAKDWYQRNVLEEIL